MENIINILMERDGVSYDTAKAMYDNCFCELMEVFEGTSALTPDEVLMCELGLEMDYIFDFI